MVKLLSYQRECIDLANGLFGIEGNASKTRKKAKKEAGKSTVMKYRIDKVHQSRRQMNPGCVKAPQGDNLGCFGRRLCGLVRVDHSATPVPMDMGGVVKPCDGM